MLYFYSIKIIESAIGLVTVVLVFTFFRVLEFL